MSSKVTSGGIGTLSVNVNLNISVASKIIVLLVIHSILKLGPIPQFADNFRVLHSILGKIF